MGASGMAARTVRGHAASGVRVSAGSDVEGTAGEFAGASGRGHSGGGAVAAGVGIGVWDAGTVARTVGGLLTDEVVLPEQWEAPHREWSPEQRLAHAVLKDAIDCALRARPLRGGAMAAGSGAALAWEWIESAEAEWPFAFVSICDVLGLSVGALRRGLRRCAAERRVFPRQHRQGGTRTMVCGRAPIADPRRPLARAPIAVASSPSLPRRVWRRRRELLVGLRADIAGMSA
jgi:hypothetical protein